MSDYLSMQFIQIPITAYVMAFRRIRLSCGVAGRAVSWSEFLPASGFLLAAAFFKTAFFILQTAAAGAGIIATELI
jgi:hypothetical protein